MSKSNAERAEHARLIERAKIFSAQLLERPADIDARWIDPGIKPSAVPAMLRRQAG